MTDTHDDDDANDVWARVFVLIDAKPHRSHLLVKLAWRRELDNLRLAFRVQSVGLGILMHKVQGSGSQRRRCKCDPGSLSVRGASVG